MYKTLHRGRHGHVVVDLQLLVQLVHITSKVSSKPAHGKVYLIILYVTKCVSGFSTNKTDCHNISKIFLKMVLNIINHTPYTTGFAITCLFHFISLFRDLTLGLVVGF